MNLDSSNSSESPLSTALRAARSDDAGGASNLLPVVYEELRRLAAHMMACEPRGGKSYTLQATALVHEAFARLAGSETKPDFEDRRHFFNAAALAMRRILIERARRGNALKHGGGCEHEQLDCVDIPASPEVSADNAEMLESALRELADHNLRWSEIVHLRYFLGLTIEETSAVLGIAPVTVKSDWTFARAWLKWRLDGR